MNKVNWTFAGKYILSGEIECVTGLHIGGSTEGIELGGVDNPVIKDPLTEYPYIPGSSLKGKLRHLLEWQLGVVEYNKKQGGFSAHFCGECGACRLFGTSADDPEVRQKKSGPTRLTVRDAFPTGYEDYIASNREKIPEGSTLSQWRAWLGEGISTEIKTENAIDRVTSEANPRPMERVPAGSAFAFEMIFDVYDPQNDTALLQHLFAALRLLENSALGGSGSRGHGQVKFKALTLEWRPTAYYVSGKKDDTETVELLGETVMEIQQSFDKIQWPHVSATS